MSSEHAFEDKGKVKPKPSQETESPQKDGGPITLSEMQGHLDADKVKRMQKTVGNSAVQRFLAQRSGEGSTELDEETTQSINDERGGGQSLDPGIAGKAGGVMGQDFSNVNVHTGEKADSLNQQLQAKAFTVGNDIFFKDGQYNPGSSEGQELISHELTHVVQQGASTPKLQGKMTVNDPNDQYEAEADAVANTVMNSPDEAMGAQRQEEEEVMEKPDPYAQRQEEEEMMEKPDPSAQRQDEEEMMEKPDPSAQRQDEEEMMEKPDPSAQRQEEEEVMEKPDPSAQRQDEEEVMEKPDPRAQRQEEELPEDEMQAKLDMGAQRQEELPDE